MSPYDYDERTVNNYRDTASRDIRLIHRSCQISKIIFPLSVLGFGLQSPVPLSIVFGGVTLCWGALQTVSWTIKRDLGQLSTGPNSEKREAIKTSFTDAIRNKRKQIKSTYYKTMDNFKNHDESTKKEVPLKIL